MSRFRDFVRDDEETVLEVCYSVTGGSAPSGLSGPPEYYDPGCPPEVEIEEAWLKADTDQADAPRVELTDAEAERFETEVLEDSETYEQEPDYDDW